eukprot:419120_1
MDLSKQSKRKPHAVLVPSHSCLKSSILKSKFISSPYCSIGRGEMNQIVIQSKQVSMKHCSLRFVNNNILVRNKSRVKIWKVEDNVSVCNTNSVFVSSVNGKPQRVDRHAVPIENGYALDIAGIDNVRFFIFDINGFEPELNVRNVDSKTNNIIFEKKETEYYLKINGKEFWFDKSLYNIYTSLIQTNRKNGLPLDLCKIIVDYSFGDIMHHIAYIIGTNRYVCCLLY